MSWTLLKQHIVLKSPLVPLSHSSFPAVFSYRIFNSCSFYYHYYHYHYYKLAVLFSFAQTSPLVLHLTVIFLGCFHWARTECWYVVRWGFFFFFCEYRLLLGIWKWNPFCHLRRKHDHKHNKETQYLLFISSYFWNKRQKSTTSYCACVSGMFLLRKWKQALEFDYPVTRHWTFNTLTLRIFFRLSMILWTAAQMTCYSSALKELNRVQYLSALCGIRPLLKRTFLWWPMIRYSFNFRVMDS